MTIIAGLGQIDLVGYVGFEFVLEHERINTRYWTISLHALHWISMSART